MIDEAKREGNSLVYTRKKNFKERLFSLPSILYGYWKQERDKKRARMDKSTGKFILKNPKLLVIVVDPRSDKLVCGYKGKVVINRIKSVNKKKPRVIKEIMSHSDFETKKGLKRITEKIDNLIIPISDTLHLTLKNGNQLYQWLDGALFNISKSLKK